jgi:hypothetical protein
VDTFTIAQAADLLEGQITKAALRKRVQRPDAPGGLRSVKGQDGKRRIPASELHRAGFRLQAKPPDPAEIVRELVERITTQEAELIRLRALPARLEADATEHREAAKAAALRAAQAEAQLEEIRSAPWWKRRKLLRV